ncbi:tRNA preQ1(34) S-adenosylmethionine ribosyltransferase-isomerase QueA [Nitrogeniibacter aestuarii]|uniref:tRNA preQ1(34) S-adenosylmethionine ribosyltransferase-isomerase QueA n=1 Tax=Nitrogeniibacter aestuarii TaxID=2815343 RepID=UPI001E513821|nr:tRNA preQ1(34) S-adenosylmethionine ribosyltransferase-isomerase QueA [Nitrogeniibacter aestuarii]
MTLTLDEFDYTLPERLIAQAPLPERSASRMLVVDGARLRDEHITDLPSHLSDKDLLVLNDTRVIHARLFGQKATGGQVEVLIERPVGEHEAIAQVRASKSPKPGMTLRLAEAFEVEVLGREGDFFHLRFPADRSVVDYAETYGALPLPPYIDRSAAEADETRYQTVFAQHPGSVAAPTAGLHFDDALLDRLRAQGVQTATVTLHVGAGTYQPVRVQNLAEHRMHRERYLIPPETVEAINATRARGGRVVAVGTTSLRALESAAADGTLRAGAAETELFITPGYAFHVVDALLTNFHLPKSTLLMLVSAFAGMAPIRAAYQHAVAQEYRFFSYGDAMFLARRAS